MRTLTLYLNSLSVLEWNRGESGCQSVEFDIRPHETRNFLENIATLRCLYLYKRMKLEHFLTPYTKNKLKMD